jgi:hypothetical protein
MKNNIMKNNTITKDSNYSLHNIDNYKKELTADLNEVIIKYFNLLIEYYKFITENIKIKNKRVLHFIINRGVDTITNVFLNLILYTKNIDITYFHCQKAFYFYVEFVNQISEDEKMFLQLTSRDASTYVYKKTIFEINNEFKKMNDSMSSNTRDIFEQINVYTSLYKNYLLRIIEQNVSAKNDELIDLVENILNKLNGINNNKINTEKIQLLESTVIKLSNSVEDSSRFFELNKYLVKKFIKNNNILDNCEKKFLSEDFITKITNEPHDKFINWLLS